MLNKEQKKYRLLIIGDLNIAQRYYCSSNKGEKLSAAYVEQPTNIGVSVNGGRRWVMQENII